jgi:hypothetical protein
MNALFSFSSVWKAKDANTHKIEIKAAVLKDERNFGPN